jgi:hypothetical protein
MRLAMFCSKSAMANFCQASRKITALLQSRPEWSLQAEFDHWIEAIDRALSENMFFVM